MPKISIIIPTYNQRKDLLKLCLESAFNQSFKDYEIILVNDGGSPMNVDKRIKLINMPGNGGIATALNKGVSASSGKYICWLSSDDTMHQDKLQNQYQIMEDFGYKISYHDYNINFLEHNIYN